VLDLSSKIAVNDTVGYKKGPFLILLFLTLYLKINFGKEEMI